MYTYDCYTQLDAANSRIEDAIKTAERYRLIKKAREYRRDSKKTSAVSHAIKGTGKVLIAAGNRLLKIA